MNDQDFFTAYAKAEVKPDTQVSHPRHTQGIWVAFNKTGAFQHFQAHKAQLEAKE